jgi:hypothetical protein
VYHYIVFSSSFSSCMFVCVRDFCRNNNRKKRRER